MTDIELQEFLETFVNTEDATAERIENHEKLLEANGDCGYESLEDEDC